jgi:hypothetical protein
MDLKTPIVADASRKERIVGLSFADHVVCIFHFLLPGVTFIANRPTDVLTPTRFTRILPSKIPGSIFCLAGKSSMDHGQTSEGKSRTEIETCIEMSARWTATKRNTTFRVVFETVIINDHSHTFAVLAASNNRLTMSDFEDDERFDGLYMNVASATRGKLS